MSNTEEKQYPAPNGLTEGEMVEELAEYDAYSMGYDRLLQIALAWSQDYYEKLAKEHPEALRAAYYLNIERHLEKEG